VGNFFSKATIPGGNSGFQGVLLYGNVPSLTVTPTVGLFYATASSTGDFVTTGTAYNTGSPHLFVIRRRSAKIDLFVDNTNVATSMSAGIDVDNKLGVRIGADGDANLVRLDGDIGEMLAVQGVLAVGDEGSLVQYLHTKWATP
jgi:hypothetical protein